MQWRNAGTRGSLPGDAASLRTGPFNDAAHASAERSPRNPPRLRPPLRSTRRCAPARLVVATPPRRIAHRGAPRRLPVGRLRAPSFACAPRSPACRAGPALRPPAATPAAMGHLYGERLTDAIDEIKAAAAQQGGGLGGASQQGGSSGVSNCLVLVAPDADAICASIIIERVLTGEKVLHDVRPVAGYLEVVARCREFGPTLRSVVLINCGAVPDVATMLWPEPPADELGALQEHWSLHPDAHVYVLDAHRPFHHRNVRSEDSVTVLDWRELAGGGDDVPRVGDSECGSALEDSDDDDDDGSEAEEDDGDGEEDGDDNDDDGSGDDAEDGDGSGIDGGKKESDGEGAEGEGAGDAEGEGAGAQPRKRRRLRKAGGGSDSDGDDDARSRASSAPSSGSSATGPRAKQQRLDDDLRALRRRRAQRHADYYGNGQFHGVPSALVAYELAERLSYGRNDLLWLAIVGVTEHFLEDRISMDMYRGEWGWGGVGVGSRCVRVSLPERAQHSSRSSSHHPPTPPPLRPPPPPLPPACGRVLRGAEQQGAVAERPRGGGRERGRHAGARGAVWLHRAVRGAALRGVPPLEPGRVHVPQRVRVHPPARPRRGRQLRVPAGAAGPPLGAVRRAGQAVQAGLQVHALGRQRARAWGGGGGGGAGRNRRSARGRWIEPSSRLLTPSLPPPGPSHHLPSAPQFFARLRGIIHRTSGDSALTREFALGPDLMFPSFVRQRGACEGGAGRRGGAWRFAAGWGLHAGRCAVAWALSSSSRARPCPLALPPCRHGARGVRGGRRVRHARAADRRPAGGRGGGAGAAAGGPHV